MQIALTKKLADALDIQLTPSIGEINPLFSWTVNWINTFDRRKEDMVVMVNNKVLEPLLQNTSISSLLKNDETTDAQLFHISRSGADAKCRFTNEGIVVLAGSKIRHDVLPSCPEYAKAVREENKENIDQSNILVKDILFKTPSGASSFVLGAPTNGNIEWKTIDGKTLKDIENSNQ